MSSFEFFAASVLNYLAQLYTLPEPYAREVFAISVKFMVGPGAWFKGNENHLCFRAKVDVGIKAVPKGIASEIETICYMSTHYLKAAASAADPSSSLARNMFSPRLHGWVAGW